MRATALLILLCLSGFYYSAAQQPPQTSCGQEVIMNHLFRQFPELKTQQTQTESRIYTDLKNRSSRGNEDVITLPVVVHIIHNNGPENISDAQVLTGLQHLNLAYANAGYYDPATGVDTKIQFCLAQRDPSGNATTGITRTVSALTYTNGVNDYTEDILLKNLVRWDPHCYINIWLVADITGAVAGYAYLPAAHGTPVDGIVVEAGYFGNSFSNDVVIAHEMGHYLGLYHTFQDGCSNADCLANGDKVCDTPPDNSTAYVSCGVNINSCSTDALSGFSTDQNDQKENYMDYGNWTCMTLFTQGQKDRMRWHIANVRSSLLNCRSCLPPCPSPVTANFSSSATTIIAGTTVNFTNSSINASGYEWYLNDVLQTTSLNYSYLFNAAGTYVIKLVAKSGNTTLCDNSIKTETILVTCPVLANFSASAVEIQPGTSVTFTNSSTGGTTYQWYVNGTLISSTLNTSYNFTAPGEYSVKLVAGNGTCSSVKEIVVSVHTACTSLYFDKIYSNQNYHSLAVDIDQLPDSSYIGCARMEDYTPGLVGAYGLAIKFSKNGNVVWAKTLKDNFLNIYDQKILHDGSVVYIGGAKIPDGRYALIVIKMTTDGAVVWSKRFIHPDMNLNTVHYQRTRIDETPDHSLVFTTWLCESLYDPAKSIIGKLTATGNLVWVKHMANTTKPIGAKSILAYNNAIYWFLDNWGAAIIVKLDAATGNIIFKKQYTIDSPGNNNLFFSEESIKNNIIQIYGANPAQDPGDSIKHLVIHIDTLGVFQKVARVELLTPLTPNYIGSLYDNHAAICANGEMIFAESGAISNVAVLQQISIYRGDVNSNTVYSKLLSYSTDTKRIYQVKEGPAGNTILFGSAVGIQSRARLFLYNSNTSGEIGGACITRNLPYVKYPVNVATADYNYTAYTDYALAPDASFQLVVGDALLSTSVVCSAGSTLCYKVDISGMDSVCTQTDSITYKATRNAGCTDIVQWNISPNTYGSRILSDSSIKVRFLQTGNYEVRAVLSSCADANDTLKVAVSRDANSLNLGPDAQLCKISTYTMKAGTGFKSYLWQDGSVDSTFTAYYPGTFYVTVTDYCNNTKRDSLILTQAADIPFDLGNDIIACEKDTTTLTAPPGFTDYTWASPYDISATSGQSVKIWPAVDTMYTVTAKLAEGCIVLDSIKVTVRPALPLDLGNDVSFCKGDSALLDAGTAFDSYAWSTGAGSASIYVHTAGTYWLAAKSANGCISRDTVIVQQVFDLPVINLGLDANLCGTVPLTLDAGPGFSHYAWSTGAVLPQINVTATGEYWVVVTDANNCTSTDTLKVLGMLPPLADFLVNDTSLCISEQLLLTAIGPFDKYTWSTGSDASSIIVTLPGTYWLQVIASNGCVGKEYVDVREKDDCKTSIYFPTAFTPDHNGVNDVFRPGVYGVLKKYHLTVYNRWGQKVFESLDATKGWDGKWAGIEQATNNYVWMATYQFEGEVVQMQKGNITLIR